MNVVIDLETTGLVAGTHEIIQIGAVLFDNDLEPMDTFMSYVKPLKPKLFSKEAQDVNGLTLDFLEIQPVPAIARTAFTCWLEDASEGTPLVPLGHNYHFDQAFLTMLLGPDKYNKLLSYRYEDTCMVIRYLTRVGKLPAMSSGLQAGLDYFGIKRTEPHDAVSDCLATLELYKKLIKIN